MRFEFLLEEESMEIVIEIIMEQIVSDKALHSWKTHPHHGKGHLLKQLLPKLRGYRKWITADTVIIIIVDQGRQDCKRLKAQIIRWVQEAGLPDQAIVRIAVAEPESWFLGDIEALEKAFPKLRQLELGNKARYRNPDERPDPTDDLDREFSACGYPAYSRAKGLHSLEISDHLQIAPKHNRSHSFHILLNTLRSLLAS